MARYQMFITKPLTAAPILAQTFEAVSHQEALAAVEATIDGETGPDADVELRHLEAPDGGVTVGRWARRAPEPEFRRV